MIERCCHSASQMICVVERAERLREFLGPFDSGVIRYRAGRKNQHVVRKLFVIGQTDSLGIKIDAGYLAAYEPRLRIQQFLAVRRDVPSLDLAAQILIEHRTEKKVILFINKRD